MEVQSPLHEKDRHTMGQLIYAVAPAIQIDDWALRHLQFVMLTKLRRDESFSFSWDNEPDVGVDEAVDERSGRHGSVWVSKASSLYFSYDESLDKPLNRKWLDMLNDAANSNAGLRPVPEPDAA